MSDQLELMLEAERRGILPDDKVELLAEARRRGLVPGGEKPVYGSKEDVAQEAARRQAKEGPGGRLGYTNATGMDTYTIGHGAQVYGGAKGLTNYLIKKVKGEDADLSTEYGRERDIMRAQIEDEEARAGPVASTAGSIVMGFAGGAPTKAAGTILNGIHGASKIARPGYTVAEQAAQRLAAEKAAEEAAKHSRATNFLIDKGKAAGYGAAFGAVYGEGRETGDLAEKASSAWEHAKGGAILAPLVKTGFDAVGAYRGYRTQKKQERADTANERAKVFEDAETPIYTPALNDTADMAARSLEGNLAAGPLRDSAKKTVEGLERSLERHLKESEGLSPAETASRLRGFLRQQLLGEGVEPGLVKNATPEQLAEMSGLPSAKPPKVAPTKPEKVPPISQEEYLRSVEAGVPEVAPQMPTSLEGRYTAPRIEEVPLSKQLEADLPKAHAEHADAKRRYEANKALVDEHEAVFKQRGAEQNLGKIEWMPTQDGGFFTVEVPGEGRLYANWEGKVYSVDGNPAIATPERQKLVQDSIDFMTKHPVSEIRNGLPQLEQEMAALDLKRQALEKEAHAYRTEMQPVVAKQRRQQALKEAQEAAQAEAALATQKARAEAVERAAPQAQQEAMRLQQQRKAEAKAAAEADTASRQAQAEAEHAREINKPFELGGGSLPVKEQLDAAYAQVRANAPPIQPNLLGERATKTTPEIRTHTVNLIDDIAREARERSELVGYKNGQIFDPDTKRVYGDVMSYLADLLPKNLVDRLSVYADKRANGGFVPNIRGIHDLRSDLRAAVRDADGWNPGNVSPRGVAALKRFSGAVDRDLRDFAHATGERGRTYIRQLDQVDAAYERYMNDLRKPLAKILDEKTDSGAIYQSLIKSVQDGSVNMDTLRRVYDLVDLKGGSDLSRTQLTGSIVGDMARDGIETFVKRWSKLSDDARAVMFKGSTEELGRKLDAVAEAGKLMESHLGVAKTNELDPRQLMRMSNLLMGTLAYAHAPYAITQAVGTYAASKILSSKWYAGWLRNAPTKSIGSPEWTRHMERMVAYTGEQVSNNPQATGALREAIGIKDAQALFAGENSQTANEDALGEAKALDRKRTDPKEIYSKTGWFKGADKQWRYEIDDKPAKLTPAANEYYRHVNKKLGDVDTTLGTLLKHEDLFKAFPEAKDIKVRLMRTKQANKAAGMADDDTEDENSWGAIWDTPSKTMIVNVQALMDRDNFRSTLLHETQHYLQDANGFDYGPLKGDYAKRYGEVEAYNVQKRLPLDAGERRLLYPPLTQGIRMKDVLLSRKERTATTKEKAQ